MIVLAGDIGGTNARLAILEVNATAVRIVQERKYPSPDYPGLAPIVRAFCQETGTRPDRACFGIACPIVGEDCTAPNLPWTINAGRLAAEIQIPRTRIINDFVAVGYGIELMTPADLTTLQEGTVEPRGPIALIGAGTGLGQGFLFWEDDHYEVLPSEGGHADFATRGRMQAGLLEFLEGQFHRVSWERLLSGPGLVNIYRFLVDTGVAPESPAVSAEMGQEDPAAVIARHGMAKTDTLCDKAVDLFVEIFGAQAGNLALSVVATGGVYLAGGIAPRLEARLNEGGFMTAFRDKGRLSELLSKIPVHVVMNPKVGMLGSAAVAGRIR